MCEDVDDAKSHFTAKTSKSKRFLTFTKCINEKLTQTDSKVCGKMVTYNEWQSYRAMLDVHNTAVNLVQRKREAKAAQREHDRARHNIKALKTLDSIKD